MPMPGCAAKAVANSPLVKTAFYGGDANWGRILAAVGYSGADGGPGAAPALWIAAGTPDDAGTGGARVQLVRCRAAARLLRRGRQRHLRADRRSPSWLTWGWATARRRSGRAT